MAINLDLFYIVHSLILSDFISKSYNNRLLFLSLQKLSIIGLK